MRLELHANDKTAQIINEGGQKCNRRMEGGGDREGLAVFYLYVFLIFVM